MALHSHLFQCAHHDAVGQSLEQHLAYKNSCYSNFRKTFGVLCKIAHLTKSEEYVRTKTFKWRPALSDIPMWSATVELQSGVLSSSVAHWPDLLMMTSYDYILQLIMQSPGWETL